MNSENNTIEKTLFIPMEIFDRELGGALALSKVAVENNWRVIFGGKKNIFPFLSKFKNSPGVFFLKSIVPGETHIQKKIINYGHKVTSLDVEGLVPSAGKEGVKIRYSKKSIELSDLLFFWGDDGFKTVKKVYPLVEKKSHIFGSPIVDYINHLGHQKENSRFKKILVATSCGYANHLSGKDYAFNALFNTAKKNLSHEESNKLIEEFSLDKLIFSFWKDFVPQLAKKFYNYEIILRPHPSENKKFWKNHLKLYKNIKVNHQGSITDQMKNISAFIHYNSTAAVTSSILGVPAYMPMPSYKDIYIQKLSYVKNLSKCFSNLHEFEKLFLRTNFKLSREHKKILISNAKNAFGDDFIASKQIISKFEKTFHFKEGFGPIKKTNISEFIQYKHKRMSYFLQWAIRILIEPTEKLTSYFLSKKIHSEIFRLIRLLPPKNSYQYAKTKQPKIKKEKIIDGFNEINFYDYKLNKISNNLFVINPKINM